MKKWYAIQNSAGEGSKSAALDIFDEIGPWGVTAKDFNQDLKAVTADSITVSINSIGGDVFAGLGIFHALKGSGKKVTVKVMGLAASIASIIAMAGDKILMPANTFMMVHNPWSFAVGNADVMREQADLLDKVGDALTAIYVNRTGKTEEEVKALLKAETYMTAAEAVENGFADEVLDDITVSAKFDVSNLPENVRNVFLAAVKPPVETQVEVKVAVESKVETEPKVPFPEAVLAAATASGLGDFGAVFALDASINAANLADKLAEAKEIVALCSIAKAEPEKAASFIKARTSASDVRLALAKSRADADEAAHVDTSTKSSGSSSAKNEISTASIWAKRAQQQSSK